MSYEFYLLRVAPNADAAEIYRQCLESQEAELNPGPILPAVEQEKHRLANLLMRFDSNLQIAEFDFDGLARRQNVDLEEMRRRYRHLELNSDDYMAIQITLWDNHADVTFPYWHSGGQAAAVLRKVWDYLEIFETEGSFTTFDPQLERVLDLSHDFADVLAAYEADSVRTP